MPGLDLAHCVTWCGLGGTQLAIITLQASLAASLMDQLHLSCFGAPTLEGVFF